MVLRHIQNIFIRNKQQHCLAGPRIFGLNPAKTSAFGSVTAATAINFDMSSIDPAYDFCKLISPRVRLGLLSFD